MPTPFEQNLATLNALNQAGALNTQGQFLLGFLNSERNTGQQEGTENVTFTPIFVGTVSSQDIATTSTPVITLAQLASTMVASINEQPTATYPAGTFTTPGVAGVSAQALPPDNTATEPPPDNPSPIIPNTQPPVVPINGGSGDGTGASDGSTDNTVIGPATDPSSPGFPNSDGGGATLDTGTFDNSQQATANSSGQPTSSYSNSASTISTCGNAQILDKRVHIFRTHDKVPWIFYVDSVQGATNASSGSNQTSNPLQFNIINPYTTISYPTEALQQEDSILFYIKTLNESWSGYPVDKMGTITKQVFWAVWFNSDIKKYSPIRGAKYFSMHYDIDSHELDLVFWANTDINYIGVKDEDAYDNLVNPLTPGGDINVNAQRALFITTGKYDQVITNRTPTGTAQALTGMFIFNKPSLLLVPGQLNGNTADAVLDTVLGPNFIEFAGN